MGLAHDTFSCLGSEPLPIATLTVTISFFYHTNYLNKLFYVLVRGHYFYEVGPRSHSDPEWRIIME